MNHPAHAVTRAMAWFALIIVVCVPIELRANGPSPAEMQTGSLLVRVQDAYVTATLVNTDVRIAVNGLVARISVMQEFANESDEWVEGIYVFPLPDKAAVDHMRLIIGDRLIEGEIREREQARKEYAAAKQEGKKTSLVEQQRANLFTSSVANIGPGESVIVEIEYLENVRYDDGTFSLRFPMTLTPRYIPGQASPDRKGSGWSPDTDLVDDASLITPSMVTASRGHRVSLRADLNAGMPLDIVASRYHPVNVSEADGHYFLTLAGPRVPMDHDFEMLWRPVPSPSARALVFTETIGNRPHYLLMVMPPDTGEALTQTLPREMIYIIDTSGSMHGVSIEQARKALTRALGTLQPGDRFNVVEFNSFTNPLFASSVPATPLNVGNATNFVSRLNANGGTEMYQALEFALHTPPDEAFLRQIVFITDGAVGNEEGLFQLIEQRLGAARLFTVGIGSAPNSWFMRKAAEAGRGAFTTISALHEVGEKMDRLFAKLEYPQVTNIAVDWPGGTVIESYPAVVPDLYRGEPVTVLAHAESAFPGGAEVRISGDSIGGAWSQELALAANGRSRGVGALWARARIAHLLDAERRGANPDTTRDEIVRTALAHHLVSRFTSLVAVDKTPARPAGDPLATERLPSLLPYGQSSSAIFGIAPTATHGPALRAAGLATLLAALVLMAAPGLRRRVDRVRAA